MDIDNHSEWLDKMRRLRNILAHVPYAARHQRELATPLFQEIDAAVLPLGLAELWAEHREALLSAGSSAQNFADQWDADYPVIKTRPE